MKIFKTSEATIYKAVIASSLFAGLCSLTGNSPWACQGLFMFSFLGILAWSNLAPKSWAYFFDPKIGEQK